MNTKSYAALLGLILLTGCSQPQAEARGGGGGTIEAINHTHWAINHFSVDGVNAIDIIGPYQGGGGGGSYGAPAVWMPGLTVKVDWETGVAFASDVPEIPQPERPDTTGMAKDARYQAWEAYAVKRRAWSKKIDALSKEHSRIVPVPDYTGQDTCGITVHFLPCDDIKVTTSCFTYGSPAYPIKEPIRMKEPEVCPK